MLRMRRALFSLPALLTLVAGGCNILLGLDNPQPPPPNTTTTTTTSTDSTGGGGEGGGTTSSTGAAGAGGQSCEGGETMACYDGPAGAAGVGVCKMGSQTCASGLWGACMGAVQPGAETCASTEDEDCDGNDCVRWSAVFGDEAEQTPIDIETDAAGNVYVLGRFHGSIQFEGAPLVSAGLSDFFVVKLDPSGKPQWSKQYGNAMAQGDADLAVDPAGNVFLAGRMNGVLNFGGDDIEGKHVFVVRLDTAGEHIWSTGYDALSASSPRIAAAPDGTVLLWLGFTGTVDFGGGTVTASGDRSGLLLRLAAGEPTPMLQKMIVAKGGELSVGNAVYPQAITVDASGNITLGGIFDGERVDFGGVELVAPGGPDETLGFLARLDKFGAHAWSLFQLVNSVVTVDPVGAVAVAHRRPVGECMLAEIDVYTNTGAKSWSRTYPCGGPWKSLGFAYASLDTSANVFGSLQVADVGLDVGGGEMAPIGKNDIMLFKLAPDGKHFWSRRFGASGASQFSPVIATAPNGDVVLAAQVEGSSDGGTVNFGSGPLMTKGKDLLIARFAP